MNRLGMLHKLIREQKLCRTLRTAETRVQGGGFHVCGVINVWLGRRMSFLEVSRELFVVPKDNVTTRAGK